MMLVIIKAPINSMHRWPAGRLAGRRTDGWMDGWMDGQTVG